MADVDRETGVMQKKVEIGSREAVKGSGSVDSAPGSVTW